MLILNKIHRSKKDFEQFLAFLKRKIKFIPSEQISPFLESAKKISPDPKDTIYLALALALKANIWSNDKQLKEGQNQISVLTTTEIKKIIDSPSVH